MKWAIRIVGALMVLFIGYLIYLGGFKRITVEEQSMGPYIMLYQDYIGDYNKTGQRISKFRKQLKQYDLETEQTFTIFLDAPGKVPLRDQRSQVGVILSEIDSAKLEKIDPNIKIKIFPKQDCAVTTFPFRHSSSPYLGVAKVYPAMTEFFKSEDLYLENPYSLEIYGDAQITYIIPKSQ